MSLAQDLRDFVRGVDKLVDEWFLEPIREISREIRMTQEALDILAAELPEPDPALKREILTLYDVQRVLWEYRRGKLRNALHNRLSNVERAFKLAFDKTFRDLAYRLLTSFRWGTLIFYIVRYGGTIVITAFGLKETWEILGDELFAEFRKTTLTQQNPRHWSVDRHRTRKKLS